MFSDNNDAKWQRRETIKAFSATAVILAVLVIGMTEGMNHRTDHPNTLGWVLFGGLVAGVLWIGRSF